MRRILAVALVGAIAFAVIGCEDKTTGPSERTKDIDDYFLPIVGATYNYDSWGTAVEDRDCTFEGSLVSTFLDTATHDGGFSVVLFEQVWTGTMYCATDTSAYEFADTVYLRSTDTQLLAYESLWSDTAMVFLQEPIQEGETWNPFPGEGGAIATVTNTNKTVITPAGTFTGCVEVLITALRDTQYRLEMVFAESVGLAKLSELSEEGSRVDILRSYTIP